MINKENFPSAYKEVYVILQNMKKEDVDKIPKDFIDLIKKNMNKEYNFKFDSNKKIEDQKVLKETKGILSYIFLNYWGTNTQVKRIKAKFRYDILNGK